MLMYTNTCSFSNIYNKSISEKFKEFLWLTYVLISIPYFGEAYLKSQF